MGIGEGADSGMGGGREIDFDTVYGLWGWSMERIQKMLTSADTGLSSRWAVTPVSFLSSRIPNENIFDRASRQFI